MGLDPADDKRPAQELALRAVELGMSPALGGDVRIELDPRTTVLVGKNGAGKSAILERLTQGFGITSSTVGAVSSVDPERFVCEFRVDESQVIRYQWKFGSDVDTEHFAGRLTESCELIEPEQRELWTGRFLGRLRGDFFFFTYFARDYAHEFEREIEHWAMGVRHVPAQVIPRVREPILISTRTAGKTSIDRFAHQLHDWKIHRPEEFAELLAVGRRTRLLHDIDFKQYGDDQHDFFTVHVDGVNFGLLSDGTLRTLQILLELIQPGTKLLLIDEPESAAHPGLLARLLAEIEAYSMDRQIVLATQSPQVVSWARPESIRLIERNAGVTNIRSLDDATVTRLERYLHDRDTLGDFVYGGGIDELTD